MAINIYSGGMGIIIAELLAAFFLDVYDRYWCCWSSDYGWSFAW